MLLWTQLKNCLEVMKITRQEELRVEELTKRIMILEQRRDHLKVMKRRSRLEPVMREQAKVEFRDVEGLREAVKKLGFIRVEPSKCEVIIPPVIVKKTTMMISLMDKLNNPVSDHCNHINVAIENIRGGEAIQVGPIKEVGNGRYEVSYTPSRCGYHMISIIVDGHHIPGSPYK